MSVHRCDYKKSERYKGGGAEYLNKRPQEATKREQEQKATYCNKTNNILLMDFFPQDIC